MINTNKIINLDLYSSLYTSDILQQNIDALDLLTIIKTQTLSYEFIINFILNEEYQITPEEKTIDIYDVVRNQPHIDIDKLNNLIKLHSNK
jgi:hypothetical protein